MSQKEVAEFAPAKVNLTLRVGQARSDGYHPLDSLVVFADWGDRVRVTSSDGLMVSMSGEASRDLVEPSDNLVFKAALMLQKASGVSAGAMIHLEKNIPVSAGLGGGSSDAAATLRALNNLWDIGWSQDELAQLALTLGADVPACIYSRPLRMRGIGEWIEVLDGFPAYHAVIINPGVPVSTADVFKHFDAGESGKLIPADPRGDDTLAWMRQEPNDLEAPARLIAPQIGEALDWLAAQKGALLTRMSGSGASCFALFEDKVAAFRAAQAYSGFAVSVELAGVDAEEGGRPS